MHRHTVTGGGGIDLNVVESGNPEGKPILFVHGWSQAHLCWNRQLQSDELSGFRLLAMDLRGHGNSDCPMEAGAYSGGELWADDIAGVIEALRLERPVLVGWSYGGFVICDYLAKYGDGALGGIDLVGGAVVMNQAAFGSLVGPGFLENAPAGCSDDLAENIRGIRGLMHSWFVQPIPSEDAEVLLAAAMVVPPAVRQALLQRELDFRPVLERVSVPVVVTHGRADEVILSAMAEEVLAHCRTARAAWYDDVGHAPFIEAQQRFDRKLTEFVAGA